MLGVVVGAVRLGQGEPTRKRRSLTRSLRLGGLPSRRLSLIDEDVVTGLARSRRPRWCCCWWWCPLRTLLCLPIALLPTIAAFIFATNYIAMGQLLPFGAIGVRWSLAVRIRVEAVWDAAAGGVKKFGIDWAKHHEARGEYALLVLVGHHGLFTLTPFWTLAVLAMLIGSLQVGKSWRQVTRRDTSGFPGSCRRSVWRLTVVVIAFYLVKTDNYGGFTNGLRWLMWLTPIWLDVFAPRGRLAGDAAAGLPLARRRLPGIFHLLRELPTLEPLQRHPWIFDLMIELRLARLLTPAGGFVQRHRRFGLLSAGR